MVGEGRGSVAPPPPRNWKKMLSEEILTFFTYEIRGESIHCTSKMKGWADRRVSIVEGREGPCPPPLEMGKNVVRRNFNLFHLCFTNEIRGDRQTLAAYIQNGREWADRRLSMVGGGGARGPCPPPLKNEKKRLPEEILTSFTYVLLMKLGGGGRSIHFTCKIKEGERTGACTWWEGGLARGAMGLCPLEHEKRKGEYEYLPISAVGDK